MQQKNEAFSRVRIDAQLRDARWDVIDPRCVAFEVTLGDGTRADYVLKDRHGRPMAVLEAKRKSKSPLEGQRQAVGYAKQLGVPFVFLANGTEVWFWEWQREAHARQITTIYSQDDLMRRIATLSVRKDPLTVPVDKVVAGRDYQLECIDTLCREINFGRRKLLVEMATGTGKTRTAAALIKRLFEAGCITRVLFLVDRTQLAKQTLGSFGDVIPDFPAYVLKPGRRFDDAKRITITTLQSMVNIYSEYSSGYFDLVVSDECHRSIYGKWSGVLKYFDGMQIGLTATPCVVPQSVLDNLPDEEDKLFIRDTLRFFEVDKPTFRYTLKQAIAEGTLVPYQIYRAKTVKTAAEGGFEVRRSELDWSAMDQETRQLFEALFGDKDSITVDPNSLERKFTIPERNRAIVREFREVIEMGYVGKDGIRRVPADGKTIVFAVTKRHAETLAQMFDAAFADKKPDPAIRYADFVVSGEGDDDTADAATKIERFDKEAFPRILVSVNMLDTGFDCPEVVNLVMARFTKSAILYQQMRGRGTRRAEHIKKTRFTMFDFVGVSEFHGDDDGDPAEGGFVITAKPSDPSQGKRKLLVLDIDDHIDPTTRGWLTLDEDGNEFADTELANVTAERGIRFEAWIQGQQGLTAEQERLLRIVGAQLRANDHLDQFPEDAFVAPPFSFKGGLAYAEQIFGGRENLRRVLDSLNASIRVS